jgi:hypothetical protein
MASAFGVRRPWIFYGKGDLTIDPLAKLTISCKWIACGKSIETKKDRELSAQKLQQK